MKIVSTFWCLGQDCSIQFKQELYVKKAFFYTLKFIYAVCLALLTKQSAGNKQVKTRASWGILLNNISHTCNDMHGHPTLVQSTIDNILVFLNDKIRTFFLSAPEHRYAFPMLNNWYRSVTVLDPCSAVPCNGGTCSSQGDEFTCTCPPGFTGAMCNGKDKYIS